MSKIDKTLEKWKNKIPRLEVKEKVFNLLKRYGFNFENSSGSHFTYSHEALKGHPDFGENGEFTIVVKGGQKVKGFYVKVVLPQL